MTAYLIRKGRNFYEMAKFEDYTEPTAVYLFTPRGCSCPARTRSCKHIAILDAWKKAGEPIGVVYSDTGKEINRLFE
jgi:hypothetical protein